MTLDAFKEKQALVEILEYAKFQRDISDIQECMLWSHIVQIAFNALGRPSLAKIDEIRMVTDGS